jgi:hypothetical protein
MATWFGVVLPYFRATGIAPVIHSFVGIRGKLRVTCRYIAHDDGEREAGISVPFRAQALLP